MSERSGSHLLRDPLHFLALGAGSGLAPYLPGTCGSCVAVLLYWCLLQNLSVAVYLGVLAVAFGGGIYLCRRTAAALGRADPPQIVWDEFVGYWIAMFLLPAEPRWMLAAFLLFRFFDMVKPWPLRHLERVGVGTGIMLDDAAAGLLSCILLHGAAWYGIL